MYGNHPEKLPTFCNIMQKQHTMTHLINKLLAIVAILFVGACTTINTVPTKTTTGEAYDVFVICDNAAWQGDLSMVVCDMLEEDAIGLTRPQGYFNIVRQANSQNTSDIDLKYSNILRLNIDAINATPSTSVARNVYARPQTVVTIKAPDSATAALYIEHSAAAIRDLFESGERDASNSYYRGHHSPELINDFKAHTGFEMLIPANYYKATTADKELLWYIRDYEKKAQYIFAYSYDYTSEDELTAEWLVRTLDNRLSTIPGQLKGSYMGINEDGPAFINTVTIGDTEWIELRGWWEVNGDFMGGPYVSYTTLNRETSRLTTIVFALYSPEEGQRNPLREIEHLIYTTKPALQ